MQDHSVSEVLISHLTQRVIPDKTVFVEGSYFNKSALGLVCEIFNKPTERAFLYACDYILSILDGRMPEIQEYTTQL